MRKEIFKSVKARKKEWEIDESQRDKQVKWSGQEEETCRPARQVANKSESNRDGRQSRCSDGSCCKKSEKYIYSSGGAVKSQLAHCPSDGARIFRLQNVQLISSGNLLQRIVSKLINVQLQPEQEMWGKWKQKTGTSEAKERK
jgi:hypothetical protein